MPKCPHCGVVGSWIECPNCHEFRCNSCGKDRRGVKAPAYNVCPACKKTNNVSSSRKAPSWAK